jgi:mercuric ion binding protein
MKKVMLAVAIVAAIGVSSCKNAQKDPASSNKDAVEEVKTLASNEASFGVRGNCNQCKKTIEKAASSLEGVTAANWDVDKKKIEVAFDESKTNLLAIHNAIAASGYDTEKSLGDETAYSNLPGCCQYDHSMEMNQAGKAE